MGQGRQAKFGMRLYPRRAHLYTKNWVDRIQDGRLAAILNAEIPLFSFAVTIGQRSLSYTELSVGGVVRPQFQITTPSFMDGFLSNLVCGYYGSVPTN